MLPEAPRPTNVALLGYYLGRSVVDRSGGQSSRRPKSKDDLAEPRVPNKYHNQDELRRSSSQVGRIAEQAALMVWSRNLSVRPEDVSQAVEHNSQVRRRLKMVYQQVRSEEIRETNMAVRTLKAAELARVYRTVMGEDKKSRQQPEFYHFGQLMTTLSGIYGISLFKIYEELLQVQQGDQTNEAARYLVDLTSIMTNLLTSPSPFPNRCIPSVDLLNGNEPLAKLDAVGVRSHDYRGSDENFRLLSYVTRDKPWAQGEIKLTTRARLFAGKINSPPKEYMDQMRHQLGVLMLCNSGPITSFRLPEYLKLILLRGNQPSTAFAIRPTTSFYESWINGLETDPRINEYESAIADRIAELQTRLYQYHELARKQEAAQIEAHIARSSHLEKNGLVFTQQYLTGFDVI